MRAAAAELFGRGPTSGGAANPRVAARGALSRAHPGGPTWRHQWMAPVSGETDHTMPAFWPTMSACLQPSLAAEVSQLVTKAGAWPLRGGRTEGRGARGGA